MATDDLELSFPCYMTPTKNTNCTDIIYLNFLLQLHLVSYARNNFCPLLLIDSIYSLCSDPTIGEWFLLGLCIVSVFLSSPQSSFPALPLSGATHPSCVLVTLGNALFPKQTQSIPACLHLRCSRSPLSLSASSYLSIKIQLKSCLLCASPQIGVALFLFCISKTSALAVLYSCQILACQVMWTNCLASVHRSVVAYQMPGVIPTCPWTRGDYNK